MSPRSSIQAGRGRSPMSAVETLLAEVLAAHSQVSGGALRYCVCGVAYCDNTTNSRKVRKAWVAHVAAEQAEALREWLTSDETICLVLDARKPWETMLPVRTTLAALAEDGPR